MHICMEQKPIYVYMWFILIYLLFLSQMIDDDWLIWKEKKNPEHSTFTDKSLRIDEKNNNVLLSILLEGP